MSNAGVIGGWLGGAAAGALLEHTWHPVPFLWVVVAFAGVVLLGVGAAR